MSFCSANMAHLSFCANREKWLWGLCLCGCRKKSNFVVAAVWYCHMIINV